MANDFGGPGQFPEVPLRPGNDTGAATPRVWIEPDPSAPEGFGRIMIAFGDDSADNSALAVPTTFSFLGKLLGVLPPSSPRVTDNISVSSKFAANDNRVWIGSDDSSRADDGQAGFYGSDIDVATLADGSTVVAWIGDDDRVHAKIYPSHDSQTEDAETQASALDKVLADLGEAGQGQTSGAGRVRLQTLGQNGFAAMWIADFGLTAALMGKVFMLSVEPAAAGEQDAGTPAASWKVTEFVPLPVPHGTAGLSIKPQADGSFAVAYSADGVAGSLQEGGANEAVMTLASATDEAEDGANGLPTFEHLSGQAVGAVEDVEHVETQPSSPMPVQVGVTQAPSAEAGAMPADDGMALSQDGDAADPLAVGDYAVPAGAGVAGPSGLLVVHQTTVVGAGDGVQQSAPKVVVTASGTPVVLHERPAAELGKTAIVLTSLTSDGTPLVNEDGTPREIVVTENAVTSDPDHPYLDLAPSLSRAGNGTAVAWAEDVDEGRAICLQVYSGDGDAAAANPVVVVLSSAGVTVSDFEVSEVRHNYSHVESDAAASNDQSPAGDEMAPPALVTGDGTGEAITETAIAGTDGVFAHETPDLPDQASPVAELAVVWVQNANDHGYGEIMGQRFALDPSAANDAYGDSGEAHGSNLSIVALGLDGNAGDGQDAVFQVTAVCGLSDVETVIGRSPMVASAGDDGLVIGWVQETVPGSGIEIIDGIIVNAEGGSPLLAFDLTALMPLGVLKGTEPSIRTTDAGDVVIGWLQVDLDGGYDAAAAIYRHIAEGQWSVPTQVLVLAHFEDVPRGFSFALTAGDDPSISVTWSVRDHAVSGATFDLDGAATGTSFARDYGNSGSSDQNSDASADLSGLASAMAPDGSLIVVYTQSDNGDSSIGAMVVSTGGGEANSDHGSDASVSISFVDVPALPDTDSSQPAEPGDPAATSLDEGTSSAASVTEQLPEISGSSGPDGGEAAPANLVIWLPSQVAVADSEDDQIRFITPEQTSEGPGNSIETSGSSSSVSGSSGSSGPGSSDEHDLADPASDSHVGSSGHDNDNGDDDEGDGHQDGQDGPSGNSGSGDGFLFVSGYGNDVADYYEEEHIFEDAGGDPLLDAFDALQFANALSDAGNMEVMTFDASNVVMIRDFETL
jgi:hypothetical protein